jgi:hypothetical protein
MRKLFAMLSCFLLLAACGGGTTPAVNQKVTGTASEGSVIANKTVKLKDANGTLAADATTSTSGLYSIDVTGLTAPYLVTVTGSNGTYVSLAPSAGTANINPITTAVVALAAANSDVSALFTNLTHEQIANINANYISKEAQVTTSLQSALPTGVTAANYFTGTITAGNQLDAIFDAYQIAISQNHGLTLTVGNYSGAVGVSAGVVFQSIDVAGNASSTGSTLHVTYDTTTPQIKSFSISPSIIDTSTQSQTLVLTLHVTDESGVSTEGGVTFTSPDGPGSTDAVGYPALVSGNDHDGTYVFNVSVPKGAAQGVWHLANINIIDDAGNVNVYNESQLNALGYQTSFQNKVQ